ncbi:hypothetical protein VM636_17805 [Streptomyces sp. SCSIO 75703]|uniref:hypothetical protein n=1 Tax=unclassified Streptomyces TaxID=2593676 RepID=UPI000AB8E9D1|nr:MULTISPECIES: hypothetical protein [unclassified Streptomyces]
MSPSAVLPPEVPVAYRAGAPVVAPALPSPPLGTDTPPTGEVPPFAPVRVRGGRLRSRGLPRHRRRLLAAGLAVTAASLVVAGARPGTEEAGEARARARPVAERMAERPAGALVTAPVRIADAATVRLLAPGDRVDVVAAGPEGAGADTAVLAHGARVARVPEPEPGAVAGEGALVVLTVPRDTAHRLAGAGALSRLAVILC